jgi:hypothetical protein
VLCAATPVSFFSRLVACSGLGSALGTLLCLFSLWLGFRRFLVGGTAVVFAAALLSGYLLRSARLRIDGAFLGRGGFGCSTALQVFFPE